MILKELFCIHKYEILKEHKMSIYNETSVKYNMVSDILYTIVQRCPKCGKIKKKTVKL